MLRRLWLPVELFILTIWMTLVVATNCDESNSNDTLPKKLKYAGMTLTNGKYCPNVTYSSNLTDISLEHIVSIGTNAISIVVTQYQEKHNTTDIFPLYPPNQVYTPKYTFVTATDNELSYVINKSHEYGLTVMLKPHIDLTNDTNGMWRGDIGIGFNDTQWDIWFENYSKFILYYAELASNLSVEIFSVSCELTEVSKQTKHWQKLIPQIRAKFESYTQRGLNPVLLTSSANWSPPNGTGIFCEKKIYISSIIFFINI